MAYNEADRDPVGPRVNSDDVIVRRTWSSKSSTIESDEVIDDVVDDSPKNRFRRSAKVTPADVENRLTQFGRSMRSPNRLRVIVGIALVLISVIAVLFQMAGASAFDNARSKNLATIKDLQDQIDNAKAESTVQPDQETANAYVKNAETVGGEIAKLQNNYFTIGSGPSSEGKLAENATGMDTYLAASKDGKQSAARVAWMPTPTDMLGPEGRPTYSWTFVSASPSLDKGVSQIDLLWTFRKIDTGALQGWAMGTYDSTTKKVTSVTWGTTASGVSLAPVTVETQDHAPNSTLSSTTPEPSASTLPTTNGG